MLWELQLAKNFLSTCYLHVKFRNISPLGYQAQAIKGYTLWFVCDPLVLARQLEIVREEASSLASERQWENV